VAVSESGDPSANVILLACTTQLGEDPEAAQTELMKHTLDTFVDNPPSVAEGVRGVVVTACPACRRQFQSIKQLMMHLSGDVLPTILRKAFDIADQNVKRS
jgi:hypothetical protein